MWMRHFVVVVSVVVVAPARRNLNCGSNQSFATTDLGSMKYVHFQRRGQLKFLDGGWRVSKLVSRNGAANTAAKC